MKIDCIEKDSYLSFVEQKEYLEKHLHDYCVSVLKRKNELWPKELKRPYCVNGHINIDYISKDGVYVTVDEYWSYGGHERHNYHISMDELFNDNWEKEYIKKGKEALKDRELKLQKDKEIKENKEREEYERLRKKFEKD